MRSLRVAVLLLVATTVLAAQYDRGARPEYRPDIDYDGRIAFARIAWQTGSRYGGGWSSAWNHTTLGPSSISRRFSASSPISTFAWTAARC